jgi:large subunit ribosomal protein L29
MKIQEARELTIKELSSRKNELEHESFNLRIQQQGGQLEKPHLLKTIRRDIARISSAISEKSKATAAK